MADIRVGDVGTELAIAVVDESRTPVDISAALSLTIRLQKPGSGGQVLEFDAVPYTDGTDGIMVYITQAGDLSSVGRWCIQGVVVLESGTFHTEPGTFTVGRNLPVP